MADIDIGPGIDIGGGIDFGGSGGGGGPTTYNLVGGVGYPITPDPGIVARRGPSGVSFQYYANWSNSAAAVATQSVPNGTAITFTQGGNTYTGTITTLNAQQLITEPTYSSYSISWISGPPFGTEFIPDTVSFTI